MGYDQRVQWWDGYLDPTTGEEYMWNCFGGGAMYFKNVLSTALVGVIVVYMTVV